MDRRERKISLFVLSAMLAGGLSCVQKSKSDCAVTAVPLTAVKFTDGFWAKRQQTDIAVTIRHEMMEAEKTNRIKNFQDHKPVAGAAGTWNEGMLTNCAEAMTYMNEHFY